MFVYSRELVFGAYREEEEFKVYIIVIKKAIVILEAIYYINRY
jgi:hypothetical protein